MTRSPVSFLAVWAALACSAAFPLTAGAQPTVSSPFSGSYQLRDLGSIPGVPTPYGGIVLKAGTTDRLLVAGGANDPLGAIYEIGVSRDADDHIDGFLGTATYVASSPRVDGALRYGPNGALFYTSQPENSIGQILPGSTGPDVVDSLDVLGVAGSTGALDFVPAGLPGAGRLKVTSFTEGIFYEVPLTLDTTTGLYIPGDATPEANLGGAPQGFTYVPAGTPGFPSGAVLVSMYDQDRVLAYDLDGSGAPIPSSARNFITQLSEPEGVYRDPNTGDVLFSTFGADGRLVIAAVPEPLAASLATAAALAITTVVRCRRRP